MAQKKASELLLSMPTLERLRLMTSFPLVDETRPEAAVPNRNRLTGPGSAYTFHDGGIDYVKHPPSPEVLAALRALGFDTSAVDGPAVPRPHDIAAIALPDLTAVAPTDPKAERLRQREEAKAQRLEQEAGNLRHALGWVWQSASPDRAFPIAKHVQRAHTAAALLEAIVPKRLVKEEVGDALELVSRFAKQDRPALIYVTILSVYVTVLWHALGEWLLSIATFFLKRSG